MNATPVIVARQAATHRDQGQAATQERWMRARRRDARKNGYRGVLTRDEQAELAAQAAQTAQGR
jgi:hypothetical protein